MKEALIRIAKKAGEIILSRPEFDIETKEGHANFVTTIDKNVQTYLEKALPELLPGSVIIGEEKENESLTDVPTWIIDPVDGTTNLIHDYRWSAVSIALAVGKQPVTGLVYQPYTGDIYYAENGKGAVLNDKAIHVSRVPFENALVCFGTSPYDPSLARRSMDAALAFLYACADIRRVGSAAIDLCYVAAGRQEIFFELTLKPWDYAAGMLIIKEAGGCFEFLSGGSFGVNAGVLAAAPGCMEKAKALLQDHAGI